MIFNRVIMLLLVCTVVIKLRYRCNLTFKLKILPS